MSAVPTLQHTEWMQHAVDLARKGWATTSPNPMVGAVVLDAADQLVGQGYHHQAGGPHAEVVALNQAGDRAAGGTLYVTLEPCCHWGRTGPCTQRIVDANVAQVVVGVLDANPQVAGQGVAALQQAGIAVTVGVLANECFSLNQRFFWNMTQHLPWISAKLALTLDGKLATRQGNSQWITNPTARAYVHDQRAGYDALLTTAATVAHDNPQLTVRSNQWQRLSPPVRVILDRSARLDPALYQMFDTTVAPTWWIVSPSARLSAHQQATAEAQRVRVVRLPWHWNGVDAAALLAWLFEQGLTSVWLECGGALVGHWLAQGAVQQLQLHYAPVWVGDAQAPSLIAPTWPSEMAKAPRLSVVQHHYFGDNWGVDLAPPQVRQWQANCLETMSRAV
jgi:diaminohydroxyphosphoribosylaminopyrimidine deaminase / 5-amino-6-(5-phosphoribosylamino)uracil reductase